MYLKKKICLITGASSGLGKEFAKKYFQNNYQLILIGKSKKKIESLKNKLKDDKNIFITADLTNTNHVNKILKKIKNIKKIDVLINNSGGIVYKENNWYNKSLNLNYFSHVYLTEKLKNRLKKSHLRKIIFISSHVHKNVKIKKIFNKNNITNSWKAYKFSKFFLTTYGFYFSKINPDISVYIINPGRMSTSFGSEKRGLISLMIKIYLLLFGKKSTYVAEKIFYNINKKRKNQLAQYFNINAVSKAHIKCYDYSYQSSLWLYTRNKLRL